MLPTEPDDDYDGYKYPEFYLPVITETPVPPNLPTPLIPEFRHKDREYKLLNHLWHVQLGQEQVRHHWNIQALQDFWRTCGPCTFEGRRYGWAPTWIVNALGSLENDLELLQEAADRATLKKRRMGVQARQILEGAGIRVKDAQWVSEEEVKLAVKLAKEDVGEEGCAGDEEVMIKKLLKDKDRGSHREAAAARSRRLRARGETRGRTGWRKGLVIARVVPQRIPLPSSSTVDGVETAKKEFGLAYRQQGFEQKRDRERDRGTMDFHSHLISSFSKRKATSSLLPRDADIRVSEYEVDPGSESEPEQSRSHALLGGDGTELVSVHKEERSYPGEGCFKLTPPASENRK
ncbi:hypothetical protein ACJ72_02677 [Emergomyces africanus]|uniref:Uncharacterized protein n=1 Tax=Emergomyces africanus TaxID=1955775 RepID=A0A1B7P2A1_9EURO|nr:hypothetical protein ACJ72_02677 [Emergomyces africanus]